MKLKAFIAIAVLTLAFALPGSQAEDYSLVTLGTMTSGAVETTAYIDATPTGEWGAFGGTNDPVATVATDYFQEGANSLKLTWTQDAVAGDGVTNDITDDDLEANESIGFWIRVNKPIASGDFTLVLTDDGGDNTYSIPAVAADAWTWVEIDVSALAAGTGDVIDTIQILITTQGVTNQTNVNMWLDAMYKWDAANEEALGHDIAEGGVKQVMTQATTAGAQTFALEAEYTDYFINYQTGNDVLVTISDMSLNSGLVLLAY